MDDNLTSNGHRSPLLACEYTKLVALCSSIAIGFTGFPALGQDAATGQALKMIIETAGQICQSAPLEQTNEGIGLSGDAKAKVGGIVGKLADIGISGTGQYESGKSVGVLQKDLVTAIQNGNTCKLEVFKTLERDLLSGHKTDVAAAVPPVIPSSSQTGISPLSSGPALGRPAAVEVNALVRSLGRSEGADRYYALQQAIVKVSPTAKISVDDALAILGGIRDPGLRFDALDQWLLPRLIIPLQPENALRLLSGFPSDERTRLLQRLQPCIARPLPLTTIDELLNGVSTTLRPSLALELNEQQLCSANLGGIN